MDDGRVGMYTFSCWYHICNYNNQPNRKKCDKCGMPVEMTRNSEGELCVVIRHAPKCKFAYLNMPHKL